MVQPTMNNKTSPNHNTKGNNAMLNPSNAPLNHDDIRPVTKPTVTMHSFVWVLVLMIVFSFLFVAGSSLLGTI
ncbi:hypothetical protein ACGTJS_09705 [Faucicola mancuniensis]|uniref:hypothetical protein n=1 Tax=Faucicola mancuniensis TaxID=1309795 RepID=UPI0028E9B746|nr:hypothetical protein [uncultured Moraxella sp.]